MPCNIGHARGLVFESFGGDYKYMYACSAGGTGLVYGCFKGSAVSFWIQTARRIRLIVHGTLHKSSP